MDDRPVTQKELDALEKYLDTVWKALGIDIAFSNHFVERLNNPRNGKQITIKELGQLYVDQYKKHGPDIRKTGKPEGEIEAILTKLSSNLNIPFVLRYNRRTKYLDLVGITVMRKAGFKSNKPQEKQYTVENKLGSQGMFFETAAKTDLVKSVQSIMQESAARHAREDYILSEVFGSSDVRQLTLEEKDLFKSIMENVTNDMDEEELQELSKKTLASYIKGASDSARRHSYHAGSDMHGAKHYEKMQSKSNRRFAGVSKAADKLAKEDVDVDEEELQELSKKTLASYVKKASDSKASATSAFHRASSGGNIKAMQTMDKRSKGISSAADKLAKEEVDVDEEEVNELSQNTLANYMRKATFSKNRAAKRMDNPKSPDEYSDAAKEHDKRTAGLSKVKKEGLEEEEEVNELSKKTLGSYVNKAAAQAVGSQAHVDVARKNISNTNSKDKKTLWEPHLKKHLTNIGKRIGGIKQATDRLTKEETDVNESKQALEKAKEAYDSHHKALGDHIEALKKLHKSLGKEKNPHWGHVGSISHTNSMIKDVLDFHSGENH